MKKIVVLVTIAFVCLMMTACDSENVKAAKEAYEAEDYAGVVTSLESEQDLSSDVEEMLNISKAHVAYDEGNYYEALNDILKVENGKDTDLYNDIVNGLIGNDIDTADAEELIKALEIDPDIGETAVKAIETQCDELNYNAFKLYSRR